MVTFRGTQDEINALKVGDVLYNFDGNRRVYDKTVFGGAAIYEKHFESVTIESETKVSWVMSRYGAKVNKKTLQSICEYGDRGYFTKSGMEADIWDHEHRHKITRELASVSVDHLKEIARIIGYNATPAGTGS